MDLSLTPIIISGSVDGMNRLKREALFEKANLSNDLGRQSVRGGAITLSSQGVLFVLRMVSTVVLARLLSPEDFGLISMVTVVVTFAVMFKDAGLSMATIQKPEITHEQISTLFWINIFLSASLGFCVLAASPLVSWFYAKPELTAVTAVLSISFIISGLTIQHQALQQRHMHFGQIACVQITAQLLTLLVTVVFALLGWRYWSLVFGTLTQAFAGTILTFLFCPWIPGWMKKGTGVRDMLKFGGHLTAFSFVNYFSRNADNLLIGKFIGASELGLYSKAYQIVYLPLVNVRNPLNALAFPVMSKMQNDPARFRRYYKKLVFAMAFLSMPLMAYCIMFPHELITLLFGERWLEMKTVFRLLAIAGFSQTVIGTRGMILLACGRSDLYLKFGTIGAILTVIGFVIGLKWGITGVAASFIITSYLPQYHMFAIAFRTTPCTFGDLLGGCGAVAVFSWFSVLCAWVFPFLIPVTGNSKLLIVTLVMTLLYLSLFFGIPRYRKYLVEVFSLLRANKQGLQEEP